MKNIICALYIVMSAALSMSAKNVTGTVVDETQQPVSFVNVVPVSYTHLTLPTNSLV